MTKILALVLALAVAAPTIASAADQSVAQKVSNTYNLNFGGSNGK